MRGLGKRYGALEVFRNIDLDVGEREIVAIVGPSGCGKTTLLRCIDGLIPLDAGEIRVGDQRVTEPIAGVAMVFQHFGLFPWKTVFDNVAYGLRMAGAPQGRDRPQGAGVHQAGRAGRLRRRVSLSDVGRHAAALRPRPRARGRAERAADGRAVRRGRCADARDPAVRAAAHLGGAADRDDLRHPLDRRGGAARPSRHRAQGPALARIHETIAIDLPEPRTRATLREPRFAELREHVWGTLMSEARAAEFQLERT